MLEHDPRQFEFRTVFSSEEDDVGQLSQSQTLSLEAQTMLRDSFQPAFREALVELSDFFQQNQVEAYLVGGLVRDLLLECLSPTALLDVDVMIIGHACQWAEALALASSDFSLDRTYPEFGTAKLCYKRFLHFDLSSSRIETYAEPGALPHITALGVSLETDRMRRDFTINTAVLALHQKATTILITEQAHHDLRNKILRILQPQSFLEDPSRMLRALAYGSRLHFGLSDDTLKCLIQTTKVLPKSPFKGGGERIYLSLLKWLNTPETPAKEKYHQLFWEHGLYQLIEISLPPGLQPRDDCALFHQRLRQLVEQGVPVPLGTVYFVFWQAQLLDYPEWHVRLPLEKETLAALHFTRAEQDLFLATVAPQSDLAIYDLFSPLPLWQSAVWSMLHSQDAMVKAWQRYHEEFQGLKPLLKGAQLKALGFKPGPLFGEIQQALNRAKLCGEIHTVEDAHAWVCNRWSPQ
jgi:tRNA nucleotidyltransferase (CCA-adding enzyme)